MWTFFTTWLTPTSLFILLNLIIATIVITSRFTPDKSHHERHALNRPPSFLDRFKSFNFTPHNSDHHSTSVPDPGPGSTPPTRSSPILDGLKSITLNRSDSIRQPETPHPAAEKSPDKTHHDHFVSRSKSEHITQAPAMSLRRRLEKSLSEKLPKLPWVSFTAAQGETEELVNEIERRRPTTTRAEIGEIETTEAGKEEVDVKADDFINKFKQQLKLQRLESLLRYRDMVTGKK